MKNTGDNLIEDPEEPTDEDIAKAVAGDDEDISLTGGAIPDNITKGIADTTGPLDVPISPHSVLGKESPFAEDTTEGDVVDIDEQMNLIGKKGDYNAEGEEEGIPKLVGSED